MNRRCLRPVSTGRAPCSCCLCFVFSNHTSQAATAWDSIAVPYVAVRKPDAGKPLDPPSTWVAGHHPCDPPRLAQPLHHAFRRRQQPLREHTVVGGLEGHAQRRADEVQVRAAPRADPHGHVALEGHRRLPGGEPEQVVVREGLRSRLSSENGGENGRRTAISPRNRPCSA